MFVSPPECEPCEDRGLSALNMATIFSTWDSAWDKEEVTQDTFLEWKEGRGKAEPGWGQGGQEVEVKEERMERWSHCDSGF